MSEKEAETTMDISNISQLFQKSNVLTGGRHIAGQAATPSDLLQQISNQIVNKQQGRSEVKAPAKAQEIRMDTYDKEDSSQPLEEMARGALEYYLQVTKIFCSSSAAQEQNLLDFKERLQKMDETIQGYQDILSGKTSLPEGLSMDDIIQSLTREMANREEFVRDGVAQLNKWSGYFVTSDYFDKHMQKILGENKFADKDCSNWELDLSVSNIYSEIDRVLAETRSVTEELNQGVQRIYDMLKKYGSEDKYTVYLESWRSEYGSYFAQIEAKSIQQLILENLMQGPLQEVQN